MAQKINFNDISITHPEHGAFWFVGTQSCHRAVTGW